MSEDNSQWEYQKGVIDAALDTQWIERRQALHESICKEPQLTWTTEKPTKEGWYWFRSKAEGPIVVRIYGSWVPTDNYKLNVWVGGLPDETDCNIESMEDGEWYGPLEIPS